MAGVCRSRKSQLNKSSTTSRFIPPEGFFKGNEEKEYREFYNIEELWADAELTRYKDNVNNGDNK